MGVFFCFKNKGIVCFDGCGFGDYVVEIVFDVFNGKKFGEEEFELFECMVELVGDEVLCEKGVLGKVKDLFG